MVGRADTGNAWGILVGKADALGRPRKGWKDKL